MNDILQAGVIILLAVLALAIAEKARREDESTGNVNPIRKINLKGRR